MALNFLHIIKQVSRISCKSDLTCRSFFINSSNGLREFNNQLSKFNGNDSDYESKINAGRLIAVAIQSDEEFSLNNKYLSERNREAILYNVTGGRNWRFKICYNTYETLAPRSMLTNEHLLRIAVLAYLTEQCLSAGLVFDDIQDGAILRRHKAPWYKKVGPVVASLDAILLIEGIHIVMEEIFKDHLGRSRCVKILSEMSVWRSIQGQILDGSYNDILGKDESQYCSMQTYEQLTFGKMAGNAFHSPVLAAMTMANYDFNEVHDKLWNILTNMGFYIMVENDYCDRYGTKTGKRPDEDINNGKLTWMLLKAKEYATCEQEKILRECYGKGDAESTQAVVNVYEQINLKEIADASKKQLFEDIYKSIEELPDPRLRNALMYPLNAINKWYHT